MNSINNQIFFFLSSSKKRNIISQINSFEIFIPIQWNSFLVLLLLFTFKWISLPVEQWTIDQSFILILVEFLFFFFILNNHYVFHFSLSLSLLFLNVKQNQFLFVFNLFKWINYSSILIVSFFFSSSFLQE